MALQLKTWRKNWSLMSSLFDSEEIELIKGRLMKIKPKNILYCSFENRFARSGGLAAVTINILPYLQEAGKSINAYLLTPFYSNIIDQKKLKSTDKSCTVPFDGQNIDVEIYTNKVEYERPAKEQLDEYYIKAAGFFEARNSLNDPYIHEGCEPHQNANEITRDSLFYCAAAPYVLKELNIRSNVVFHLQEWQTALISLTAKESMLQGILESCGTVQTMHNPYDSFISLESLSKIADNKRISKMASISDNGMTAYQIGLQLVDGPVDTVSENFAKEFTTDILHTEHFAPHLQPIFNTNGVYGIANGMFISFSPEFPQKEKHTRDEIWVVKSRNRKSLLEVLKSYNPPQRFGELTYKGGPITKLPENIPIFVMSGRLDPVQKGYDIFLRAVEKFEKDKIKVVVTPMPVRQSDLDIFHEAAEKCNGNLTVFPIRMEKGFRELQTGSTYGMMPSVYEPFGAAVEYMANGTVNIARATGGLVDQIENNKSGLLYRENNIFYTADSIRQFSDSQNDVVLRKDMPWVQSMVDELYEIMVYAITLYQNDRNKYLDIIRNGFKKAASFTWDKNVKDHLGMYKKISNGFV
ncbi:MAG: glycogen/starch synthase [Candidatus Latescibacteria bacterium]|nr:glycogen/starch synthase [Candidatus Latescibacterota bacterium]